MRNTLLFLLLALTVGCSRTQEIILLHTNDHHGALLPADSLGGIAERAALVAGEREAHRNVLLLDGGDINGEDFFTRNGNAAADILAYNRMGYDAMAVGDHDLNRPIRELREQEGLADFPFLSANVRFDDKLLFKPYLVKEYNGFRIGIFGLTTHNTANNSSYARNLEFQDEIEAAQEAVDRLRNAEKADMVVALSHLGIRRDDRRTVTAIDLARRVRGIDLIVDAHSHTYLNNPLKLNETYIVSAYEKGEYVGRAEIGIRKNRIESFRWRLLPVRGIEPDSGVAALVAPYLRKTRDRLGETIGTVAAPFGADATGTLACDALMSLTQDYRAHPRFVFLAPGMPGKGLPAGPVSRKEILELFPGNPDVVVLTVRGDIVKRLFDDIARQGKTGASYPQLSRNIAFPPDGPAHGLRNIVIDGKPLDYSASYGIVTTADQAFGEVAYPLLLRRQGLYNTSSTVASALMDYVETRKTIVPAITRRAKHLDPIKP